MKTKEQQRIYWREWYWKNKEKRRALSKKRWGEHPEYGENLKRKYQTLKDKYGLGSGTIMRFGFRLALQVYEKFERKCSKCSEENDLTIHHLDRNGRNNRDNGLPENNELNNLILICRSCHGRLHSLEYWKNKRTLGGGNEEITRRTSGRVPNRSDEQGKLG